MNLDDARRHAAELSPADVNDSPREDHLVEVILALRTEVDRLHAVLDTMAAAIATVRASDAAPPPRTHRVRHTVRGRAWLAEDDRTLVAYPLLTDDELGEMLGRTGSAIKARRSKLAARANRRAIAELGTS